MGGRGSNGERNSKEFSYSRSSDIKEWSTAEENRTKETTKMVDSYLYAGDSGEFMEYYDTVGDDVYTQRLGEEFGTRESTEATIMKEQFTYAQNWDENDNRVKKGKKISGTIYYTVAIDGETLNENVAGYKTLADAKHALALELDYMKQRHAWEKHK